MNTLDRPTRLDGASVWYVCRDDGVFCLFVLAHGVLEAYTIAERWWRERDRGDHTYEVFLWEE